GLVLAVRDDPAAAFRMTTLSIALCSPLAWRANFVLALPAVSRLVARARQGDGVARGLLGLVVLASLLTSGVFLDRAWTERALASPRAPAGRRRVLAGTGRSPRASPHPGWLERIRPESMADLLTMTPQGLYCARGGFHVDPWAPVPRAVLTHAHADHAREGSA